MKLKPMLRSPGSLLRPYRIYYSLTAAIFVLGLLVFSGVGHLIEAGGFSRGCRQWCFRGLQSPGSWLAVGGWNGSTALDKVADKWKGGIKFGTGLVDQIASRWKLGEPRKRPHPSCQPADLVYMYELPTVGLFNVGFFDEQGCWKFFGHHPRNACVIYDPDQDGFGPPSGGVQQARLKELGTPPGAWADTGQFALEIMFHRWLEKQYPCRTLDPQQAASFYVPFYSGIAHMYNYELRGCSKRPFCEDPPDGPPCDCKNSDYPGIPRLVANDLLAELKKQPYLERRQGRDHFIVISRVMYDVIQPWGCCSSGLLKLPETHRFTKLGIETSPGIDAAFQIGIPYPTCFHPRTLDDVITHQKAIVSSERDILVSFVGAFTRPGLMVGAQLREALGAQCEKAPGHCRHIRCDMECECGDVLELQMRSEFCLQPTGDTPTRRSLFDALQAGCIPVLFQRESAYEMYPDFLPPDENSYSVYIPSDEFLGGTVDIVERLRSIPPERKAQMRGVIAGMLVNTTYSAPEERLPVNSHIESLGHRLRDAFHIALSAALGRMRKHSSSNE